MTYLGQFADDPYYMTPEEEQRVIDRNHEEHVLALDAKADEWIAYLHELASVQVKTQIKTDILQAAKCFQHLRDAPKSKLSAAAPDLLNALENLYALVQGECPSLLEDDHHDEMVSAAIAKAKG